jgi:glutamine amidotransferase
VTGSAEGVLSADIVILPGVGAAADTVAGLKARGLAEPVKQVIEEGRPFLGVCIGLQILFDYTEEGGLNECLGIIPGMVRRLPSGLKVPHMGWNQVKQKAAHPVFDGIPDETNFYFVHSYYAEPEDKSLVIGGTEYGIEICSAVARGNMIAVQFHPEKSGEPGLKFYDNFIKYALANNGSNRG